MIALLRLGRNGNATTASIPKRMLQFLGWSSGQYVVLEVNPNQTITIRPAARGDIVSAPAGAMELPLAAAEGK